MHNISYVGPNFYLSFIHNFHVRNEKQVRAHFLIVGPEVALMFECSA